MATFGEKLKNIRVCREYSQEELASILGTTKQVISRYENNQRTPKITIAREYANKLNVPLSSLIDDKIDFIEIKNIIPLPEMVSIPLLGTIACGEPILAQENIEGYVKAPVSAESTFALTCKGDSMIDARILDGDIVLIRQQPDVDNGDIAAVLIENEATLKRVYKDKDGITLVAANRKYAPWRITGPELDEVRILGKAVYFISTVQ